MLHLILIFKEVKVTETNRCEDLIAVKLFKFSHEERIMSKNISVLLEKKICCTINLNCLLYFSDMKSLYLHCTFRKSYNYFTELKVERKHKIIIIMNARPCFTQPNHDSFIQ